MRATKSGQAYLRSVQAVFSFFWILGRRARRTKVFYLVSLFPALIALVDIAEKVISGRSLAGGIEVFTNIIMVFYLQFLILLLALFFGTSVCSEELEGKTLTYITTRPVPKSAFVLGKYAAYTALTITMTAVGVVLSFLFLNVNSLLDLSLYKVLARSLGVLILGLVCYSAFFTFIGTFLKKAVIFGLVFSFGWENVIQYFPGSTQRFAIVHYLKSLLPSTEVKMSVLLFRLEPTPAGTAVLTLFVITTVFLALACLVFRQREYILED